MWCLFLPGVHETVSQRVEREVTEAMFQRRHLYYGSDDEDKEHSVRQYKNWLFEEHSTCRSALKPESTEGRPWGQPLKKAEGAPLNLG